MRRSGPDAIRSEPEALINGMVRRAAIGIQQVVTAIDADLPIENDGRRCTFRDDEIALLPRDDGDNERLFRIAKW